MYSYKTEDNIPHKRCKGIKKCVIEEITHTDYDNCLNNREQLSKKQKLFTSDKHKVYTIKFTLLHTDIIELRNYKIIYL